MIERTFYHASKVSVDDIEDAKQTCHTVWTRIAKCL
jgi:hypothetical protein